MATRNPYYIQPENQQVDPIDWNTVIGDLTTRYREIKKDREGQREALDALVDTNTKILQATQLGKSPSANEFILKGTEMGRSKLNEWNKMLKSGQLSPSDYKQKINNLMDNWNQLAITTKTYDERMQEIFKNQQPDENGVVKGSALELERANELAQYQDLKNKTLMFDDQTGKIFLAKVNDEGILDPTSVTDPRSLNNFANIIDNKVQLANLVDDGVKGWKSFTIENGRTTVNDIRQNKDAYAKAKASLINGILSNDSAIASVLTDYTNDEYDYYLNNDDFLSRVQKRIQTENYARELNNKPPMTESELNKFIESQKSKFILLQHDDQGILQPKLTQDQKKVASKVVDAEIEVRMGREETMDEPQYRSSGSGGDDSTKTNDFAVSAYIASNKALNQGDFSNLDNDKYNFSQEIDSGGKKYVLVSARAYDKKSGTYYDDPKAKKIRVYSADALTQYIKGVDKQKALPVSIYNSGKEDYRKLNNSTLEGSYQIPTATRADWKKSGWTDDQINQAQKQGKIKVI